jgi:UDP-N-acetylglucosamine:LPS N-acetylglucosamine transferase
MISKPGGGSLLDSFTAATPLIFVDPVGEHERYNRDLWTRLGFGVTVESWLASGCSLDVLRDCQEQITAAQHAATDYAQMLIRA